MAKENSLEMIYTGQMQELGIYQKAFDPEIRLLCQMEREYRRMLRTWKAGFARDAKNKPIPEYTSKTYERITKLRADILSHRDSLGLTPKGLKRLRPDATEAGSSGGEHPYADILQSIEARCAKYE